MSAGSEGLPRSGACVEEVDRAIAREDGERAERRAEQRSTARRFFALPRLLRWMGASVLVVAGFTFMVQSWGQGSDVARYFHFLAFTGVLTGAGFFCGLRIGDEKGARTFLGLAAGAVPVHFTVLGALLYSQAPGAGLTRYPDYAHFTAPDPAAALLTAALGVAALAPVCWIAFLAFARAAAGRLSAAYLLANAVLLLPTRDADAIGLLALGSIGLLTLFETGVLARIQPLRTPEGRFARLLMAVPLLVLVGRTFNLYEASSLVFAAVFAIFAVLFFWILPATSARSREAARGMHYASLLPTSAAWLCVAHGIAEAFHLGAEALLPLACLPLAGILAGLSLHTRDAGAGFRRLASLVATGGMALELLWFPGVLSSVACLSTAILAAAHGYAAQQRGIFVTGLGALAFGLLYHLRYAAELYAVSPWGSLALLGIATVLAASYVERHHRTLVARALELKHRVDGWSA